MNHKDEQIEGQVRSSKIQKCTPRELHACENLRRTCLQPIQALARTGLIIRANGLTRSKMVLLFFDRSVEELIMSKNKFESYDTSVAAENVTTLARQ